MTDIREHLIVHCPDREASQHLAAFGAEHRVGDGTMRVLLHLPAGKFADRRFSIERSFMATMYALQSVSDPHPTYSVSWSPAGDGPFAEFAGALAVEQSARNDCFGLILSGHYEASSDAAGVAFDAASSRRTAQRSVHDLLRSIARYVEHGHAHQAAAHAGHRPQTTRGSADAIGAADGRAAVGVMRESVRARHVPAGGW